MNFLTKVSQAKSRITSIFPILNSSSAVLAGKIIKIRKDMAGENHREDKGSLERPGLK